MSWRIMQAQQQCALENYDGVATVCARELCKRSEGMRLRNMQVQRHHARTSAVATVCVCTCAAEESSELVAGCAARENAPFVIVLHAV